MATNGFFGKVKAMFGGKADRRDGVANEHQIKRVAEHHSSPRGRSMTRGAFGGTGTGRNLRGKPGVKLLKKTVRAGFRAQKRVVFGMSGRTK